MGWNRPTSNTVDATSSSRPSGRGKMPRLRRGLLAGIIVVLGAGLAAWLLTNREAASSPLQKKDRGLIKEVAPKLPPKSAAQLEKEAHPGMVKVRGKWYPEYDEKGGRIWIAKNWVRYHTPQVMTNEAYQGKSIAERIFTDRADVDIANMLLVKPGSTIVGDYKYGDRFTKAFLESLKHPIIISADDDERTAQIKAAVREAKIELKARYDAGEDIGKIMDDTKKEYRQLALYRAELKAELAKIQRGAHNTAEETAKLYEAANKMLAARGAKPLSLPKMLQKKLELEISREADKGGVPSRTAKPDSNVNATEMK